MTGSAGMNFVANGTIQPSRFVKLDATAGKNFMVIAAAATNDAVIGVSSDESYDPPGVTGSATDAARQGLPLKVFTLGDVCLVKCGGAGLTAGNYLTSDASGQAVVATNSAAFPLSTVVCGIALETCNSAELLRIQIVNFKI